MFCCLKFSVFFFSYASVAQTNTGFILFYWCVTDLYIMNNWLLYLFEIKEVYGYYSLQGSLMASLSGWRWRWMWWRLWSTQRGVWAAGARCTSSPFPRELTAAAGSQRHSLGFQGKISLHSYFSVRLSKNQGLSLKMWRPVPMNMHCVVSRQNSSLLLIS